MWQKWVHNNFTQIISAKTALYALLLTCILLIGCQAQKPRKAYKTGKQAFEQNEYIRAIGWLSIAINSQKKQYDNAYIYRGKSYLALERESEAIKDFVKATQLKPNNAEMPLKASELLYKAGEYNKALQYATTTLDRDSANFQALKVQALALTHTGKAESALILVDQAAQIKEDAELLYAKALASDSLELTDYAIAYYKESIEKKPNFKPPYHALGKLLAKNGYYDRAIDVFTQSAKHFNDTESFRLRSILYGIEGNTKAQINDITKILTLNPSRVDLYFQRAVLYKKVNLLQNALADINNYLHWDPLSSQALLIKGKLLEELHMDTEAIDVFEDIVEHSQNKDDVNYAKEAIRRLKQEKYPPNIKIISPAGPGNKTIALSENAKKITIKGIVTDASKIEEIRISDENVNFQKNNNNYSFSHEITTDTLTQFNIKATDTYNNTNLSTYKIIRTEKEPPIVFITSPVLNTDSSITASKQQITLKGYIQEQSALRHLIVSGKKITTKYKKGTYFFQDKIDLLNVDTIEIEAVDYFSNTSRLKIPINIPDSVTTTSTPMGKTWMVLISSENIDNHKIKPIENLRKKLTNQLKHFILDSVVLIQSPQKEELERKLLFELPQVTKNQRVESLVIYYIGPGMTYNNFSYWILNSGTPDKKYAILNTSLLRTVSEAFDFIRFKTIVSESVHIGKNILETKEEFNNLTCENMKRLPDKGLFYIGIKVEKWSDYESKILQQLHETVEMKKNCFSPSNMLLNKIDNISYGILKENNTPMFPVIIYLKDYE